MERSKSITEKQYKIQKNIKDLKKFFKKGLTCIRINLQEEKKVVEAIVKNVTF